MWACWRKQIDRKLRNKKKKKFVMFSIEIVNGMIKMYD